MSDIEKRVMTKEERNLFFEKVAKIAPSRAPMYECRNIFVMLAKSVQ